MDYKEFKENCNKGYCVRNTIMSSQCKKEYKIKKCYKKYIKQLEKNEIKRQENYEKELSKKIEYIEDEKWTQVLKDLHERDKTCRIWAILTIEEKNYILDNYSMEYNMLKDILDPAHILSRANAPKLYYDLDNLVLVSRYFHSLLDDFKSPVDQSKISKEEKLQWFREAREGIRKFS